MKPTKKPAKGQQLLTCFFNRGHGIRNANWVVPTTSSTADGASIDSDVKAVLAPPLDKNPRAFGRFTPSVKGSGAAEVKRGGTAEVKDGGEVEGGIVPPLVAPTQRSTGLAKDATDRGFGAYTSVKRKRDADPEDEKENVRRPPPQGTVQEGPCCGEGMDLLDDWDVDDFDVDDFDADSECLEQRVEPIFRSVKAVVTGLSTGPCLELESADGLRERLTCQLDGTWRTLEVHVGDRVYVHAPFAGRLCMVDDTKGLVVVHPDTLVSTSSVVASLWCPRKSLLAAKFKEAGNRDMLAGTVAHELFQKAVTENASEATMLATLDKLLQRSDLLHQMYALELSEVDMREQLRPLVPRIAQWMRECMATGGTSDRRPAGDGRPVAAVVTRVADIEENHWCPRLGLKGKVDASVEVALHKKPTRVPLELKTGRHTFSHDHKAQVVLYSLMMAERQDWDPQEGLLLYLRDGVDMRWVASPHRDRGALVQRRNELAQCLQPGARLPAPIDSERHCPKCPHAVVCSAFRGEPVQGEERPAFVAQSLSHLSPSHRAYLLSWCRMLDEEGYHAGERDLQEHFWLDDACSRESRGLCLSDLSLVHCEAPPGDDARPPVRHMLERKRGAPGVPVRPLPPVSLAAGDRVVLSEQGSLTCVALATGTLATLTESHIELLLDRDTRRSPGWEGKTFRVDRSPSAASAAISYTFLGRLVGADPRAARLRALLVDGAAPSFRTTLPREVATLCRPALRGLNDTQRRAVLRFLMCDDYLLLRGMPGTGKTTTLAALVHALVLLKKRVLVTSYTHSGVDSILLKLRSRGVPFLRLGPTNRMHPLVKDQSAETLTAALKTTRELEEFYGAQAVVACTCLGSSSLRRQQFDACVVDEASQAPQPSCLGPLFLAERFLLAGDPKQLPPVVQSPKARDMGMDVSLFARLETEENTAVLPIQYRMNQTIMDVCNSLAYEGRLECGSAEVSQATLSLPGAELLASLLPRDCWLLEALSPALGRSVVFVCTDGLGWAPEKAPSCNRREAGLSALVLAALLKGGLPESEVGVVAPFRRQVALLRALCPPAVEVGTVDQFQGKERAVMLLSCTVARATTSAQDSGGSILDDERRLSVALSRARHKLVLVGSSAAVAGHPPFARLLALLGPDCLIRLSSGDDKGLEGLLSAEDAVRATRMRLCQQGLPLLLLTTQRGAPWLGRLESPCTRFLPPCLGFPARHMSTNGSPPAPHGPWRPPQDPVGIPGRCLRSLRWAPIPLGLGLAYLAYLRSLRRRKAQEEGTQPVASDLQVSFYRMLPLRMASRWWGWANDIALPVWLRGPVLGLFAWAFGCDLGEAQDGELRHYRNLGEFFRRALKPGLRPVCPGDCVVSPADGRVLHFGRIEKGFAEQVKGITYSLQRFLGPHPWDPHCLHTNGEEEYQQKLLQQEGTELYHCVVYLAPGDYHRFHSPVQWEVQHRRHFPGTLLSVRPGVVNWIAGLFNMNERVVYMGHWQHGFFSMTAVGATNVGSIKVYFDSNLVTNRRRYRRHDFDDQCFQSNHNEAGVRLDKGDPFGEFNLGSTVVLIFEAPKDFALELEEGQHIRYGQLVGRPRSAH